MNLIETILDAIDHFLKHGISWASIAGALLLFLRNRSLKRRINRMLPRRLQDPRENDLQEIKQDVKAIMNHLGVEEGCAASVGSTKQEATKHGGFFTRSSAGSTTAASAGRFITFILRRMSMNKFLSKLGSRKFWALIASLVTANMVLFGYSDDSIVKVTAVITQFGSVLAYILVEGGIDKESQKQQVYVVNQTTDGGVQDGASQSQIADQPRV